MQMFERGIYEEAILNLAEMLRDVAQNDLQIGVATETARVHLVHAANTLEHSFPFDEEEVQMLISDIKQTASDVEKVLRS
jgi:predicted trehalose synthase